MDKSNKDNLRMYFQQAHEKEMKDGQARLDPDTLIIMSYQYSEMLYLNNFDLSELENINFCKLKYAQQFETFQLYKSNYYREYEIMMNQEYGVDNDVESQTLEKIYLQKIQEEEFNLDKCGKEVALLGLKQIYEQAGVRILFSNSKDSTKKQNLKIISAIQEKNQEKMSHLIKTGVLPDSYFSVKVEETYQWDLKRVCNNKREFVMEFKEKLMTKIREICNNEALAQLQPEDILILAVRKGSIIVDFIIQNHNFGTNYISSLLGNWFTNAKQQSINNTLEIQEDYFDQNFNMEWKYSYEEFRGNINGEKQRYQLPVGYHGIGLNVVGKYPDKDWFKTDTSDDTWIVLFHKTQPQYVGLILKDNLKPGHNQVYDDDHCRFGRGVVGNGVYFSDNINQCRCYGKNVVIHGKEFELVFQCRVNPQTVKSPKTNSSYYVVNSSADIRPYRILVKEAK